jgi:predicted Zn-dependent protease
MYLNQPRQMAACFRRVVALDPNHPAGHYHLAAALCALDQIEQAAVSLSRAIQLGHSPDPELIRTLQRKLAAQPSTPAEGARKETPTPE